MTPEVKKAVWTVLAAVALGLTSLAIFPNWIGCILCALLGVYAGYRIGKARWY